MPFVEMLVSQIDGLVEDRFSIHPFSIGISTDNFPSLIGNYLAMSIAFPYLQAGAQYRVITECIRKEKDVTKEIEITVAVGAFLTWDEVGGHAIVQQYGNEGLPKKDFGDARFSLQSSPVRHQASSRQGNSTNVCSRNQRVSKAP